MLDQLRQTCMCVCVCVCVCPGVTCLQMGLHVFFGCYHNLFRLMAKCGVLENLLPKENTHTFCNNDGDVRELDFRLMIGDTKIGAPFHGRSTHTHTHISVPLHMTPRGWRAPKSATSSLWLYSACACV